LCPAIYGHELVKAGLILGLFGGTAKFVGDQNCIPVRGDPHILIVGDPGLGKSQMLQAAANIVPRGVYVCGNTTTTSGLTVTLSKDGASGDYALEAGALVLGDMGCCCIDEFDKMGSQHQALLEAMEQQSISIAKAGIVCSLPARTSILAAANPAGGHYNKAKTVAENLKMGSALLSRFDLVFILLDKPDEEMDMMLSEHVMALHAGKRRCVSSAVGGRVESVMDLVDDDGRKEWEKDKPLSERLKFAGNEVVDPVPVSLFRKYVGYGRRYVHPKLSQEAAAMLQKFYLELRQRHHSADSTPITTRQLESLIRLSEARARIELREIVTQQDAEDVIEIMKYSMMDTYSDDFGVLDFHRSQHGSGMSSRNQAKRFVAELNRISERTYNSLFSIQQMRQIAKDMRLRITNFDDFIASLNHQNFLLQKGPRVYQVQSSSCL
jgi:DNA helicase MCM8